MPELRRNPLSGTWVVIATERGKRPSDFARPAPASRVGACPFCYGNERMTPPEVLAYRDGSAPDTPGWSVRVVPNKFPALSPDLEREEARRLGPFLEMGASGGHEVLIESPRHDSTLGTHNVRQVELVLRAVKKRLVHYRDSGRAEYVQVFKNAGAAAGASLEHTHFQIIALPLVPDPIQREAAVMNAGGGRKCALCDIREWEAGRAERVIDSPDGYLVFCPFASRFPYETWIVPEEHKGRFEDLADEDLSGLAPVIRDTVRRMESAFDDIPYNLILHTAPFGVARDGFHWYIEILPRLTIAAGFEFGTGQYINPTPSEMAAGFLREIDPGREFSARTGRVDAHEGDRPGDTRS